MEITQENIERGERMQQAEVKKCEMAIEKAEQELIELKQPKGLFGTTNKKAITSAEEKLPYNKADIHGKIHLSEDVKVYNNGVYYSIGDFNFAPGSKLTVFTEEAVFTIVVESITQIDK